MGVVSGGFNMLKCYSFGLKDVDFGCECSEPHTLSQVLSMINQSFPQLIELSIVYPQVLLLANRGYFAIMLTLMNVIEPAKKPSVIILSSLPRSYSLMTIHD